MHTYNRTQHAYIHTRMCEFAQNLTKTIYVLVIVVVAAAAVLAYVIAWVVMGKIDEIDNDTITLTSKDGQTNLPLFCFYLLFFY